MERPAILVGFCLGLLFGVACYFSIAFLMSRLNTAFSPKSFVSKQADVFAGILCRTTFDISFCFMDGKISYKTLTMPPNEVAGAIRRRDSHRKSAGGSTFYVMRH
jgi:hypothetical protein